MEKMNPSYPLPKSAKTAKSMALARAKVQTSLLRDFVATFPRRPGCMMDLWKDRMGNHYLGIALSFMTTDWKLFAVTISLKRFNSAHTAMNIVVRILLLLLFVFLVLFFDNNFSGQCSPTTPTVESKSTMLCV
jgi:hypothetical protein